ncbi:unnamed protein product [Colias eurytheme]|nr:unnamed protein product [Colias eurytheme]
MIFKVYRVTIQYTLSLNKYLLPAKVAQSLLLFCQGQGLLTSLPPPGVERRMSRAMSMEEYDKPNIRRLSLTPNTAETPPPRKL